MFNFVSSGHDLIPEATWQLDIKRQVRSDISYTADRDVQGKIYRCSMQVIVWINRQNHVYDLLSYYSYTVVFPIYISVECKCTSFLMTIV